MLKQFLSNRILSVYNTRRGAVMSKSRMIDVGNGHWNLRDSFTFALGAIDIGTHMSFLQLSNGKFLVLDTCAFNDTDKAKIDELTENGTKIEAVVATHPFHTMYFERFHKLYPNAPYYGSSRHIKRISSVPWAGNIEEEANLRRWEEFGVFMRVPAGADFVPTEESNHFSGLFVYHQASRSVFNDDTVLHFDRPGCLLRCLGKHQGNMEFWDMKKGLRPEASSAAQFEQFIEQIIADWDFDTLVLAHTGNVTSNAKQALLDTLKKAKPQLQKLGER